MKNLFVSLALVAVSATAFAGNDQPLVSKINGSGFVMPEYARSERCDIFSDKVVITKSFGYGDDDGFTTTEQRAVSLSAGISKVIDAAAAADLKETENGLCDGPSTEITATQVRPAGNSQAVTVFSTGGCGSNRQERQGGAAQMLRDLVDGFCGTTYDFGTSNSH